MPVLESSIHPERADRPLDVLQRDVAQRLQFRLEPALDGIVHRLTPRSRPAALRFQPGRDVDAIAIKVVAVDDQVAKVQADAEHDGGVLGRSRLASAMACWNSMAALSGIDRTGELRQDTVAGQLDQPAAVAGQRRLQTLRPMGF